MRTEFNLQGVTWGDTTGLQMGGVVGIVGGKWRIEMRVGFIGGGNMATAMIASLVEAKVLVPHEIHVSDVSADRRALIRQNFSINVYSKNVSVPGVSEVLFLAVKPQQMEEVLKEIGPVVGGQHLVISIAAGKKLGFLESLLPAARLVRVMPNLPCTVAEGMSVFCMAANANEADRETAVKLLSAFGRVLELPESQFDAVTAVSGSGPAFFSYFLSLVVEGGVKAGLSRECAQVLACQTMMGTAKLLSEKKLDPAELIKSVASAKGTTAAGLAVLDNSVMRDVVMRTVEAAARRSAELSG